MASNMTYREAADAIARPVASVHELDPMARELAVAALKAVEKWEDEDVRMSARSNGPLRRIYTDAGAIIGGERETPIQAGLENAQRIASACLAVIARWDETAGYDGAPVPDDRNAPPSRSARQTLRT